MIAISDAHTGNVVSVLHHLPWDGMEPTGLNIDSAGELWITLSTGPRCSSDINGCGPLPVTCRSEILVANPATGAVRTVLQGGDNELISDAVPSPDGRRVAFLHSGCADYFFTDELAVRDISSGRQTVIGADLPPCHVLAQPHWSTDSASLAVVYGPASTAPSPGAGYGSCSTPQPSSLVLVSAQGSQPTITGRTAPADPACNTQIGVPTANGYVAIEHCGSLRRSSTARSRWSATTTPLRRSPERPSAPAKTAHHSPLTAPGKTSSCRGTNTATRQGPPSPAPS